MNGIWLVAGCLIVMMFLGFGCLGGKAAPVQQSKDQALGNLGDSDISPQEPQNDSSALSNEDVIPDDDSGTVVPSGSGKNMSAGQASDFSDSDIDVIDISDSDLISAEDVVGADN